MLPRRVTRRLAGEDVQPMSALTRRWPSRRRMLQALVGTAAIGALAVGALTVDVTAATTTKARTLDPKALAAAVRAAAVAPASLAGSVLGKPSCPSGAAARAGNVVQCLVAFDKTPIAFLVTVAADGTLTARPTFVLLTRAAVERAAGTSCGKERIYQVPAGGELVCASKSKITLRVSADGTLTRL